MSLPFSESIEKKDLVQINNLVTYFPVRSGLLQRTVAWVQAVDDVSFTIRAGENDRRAEHLAPGATNFWLCDI